METAVAGGFTKRFDIPLGHLEFDYVKSCSDVKELEKILKVLRSNEEGHFPELERCCENRLTSLNPNSRVLRRDKPVGTKGDLDRDEREELDNDLKSWTDNIKFVESELNAPATEEESELPPIRSGNITLTADGKLKETSSAQTNKRAMPRDYREWDKVDIDKELEKVDEHDGNTTKTFVGNKEVGNIPDQVNTSGLSEQEKQMKANREKDKGNEAFRSGDFKEAISYYSRSISLFPTAASYNNRALAYLKHEDWEKALADTNTVMKIEPQNIKALLRRGSAYKGLKQYDKAKNDLNAVLELEPNNKKAQDLMEDILKTITKEREEKKKKGRRMQIEEVDEDNEQEEQVDEAVEIEVEKPPTAVENDISNSKLNGAKHDSNGAIDKRESESSSDNQERSRINNGDSTCETNVDDLLSQKSNKHENKEDSEQIASENVGEPVNGVTVNGNISKPAENGHIMDSNNSLTGTSVITNDTSENTEDAKENGSDAHVLMRPVFHKTEFPVKCANLREEANSYFRNGQYGEGCQRYTKLITLLEKANDQIVNLSLTYSNRAACHLKTGDLPSAVKDCTKSLELVPHSVKPLLRRAMAYEHLERYDKAYIDYRHVLLVDGNAQQAHLGTKRCQDYLSKKDGPRWREKIKLTQVSQWEIPEICDMTEGTQILTQTQPVNQQIHTTDKPKSVPDEALTKQEEEHLTPQQKFDKIKGQGNECVKKGNFKEAVQWYTECTEILPDEMVSYTNRALCYIRLNQADKAECDCTRVLDVEKDNVKALFRRAQSRKMLKNYSDGIKDLKHLLDLEPKNGPAKKEMEVLKSYWREQLQNMKKDMPANSPSPDHGKTKSQPAKQDSKSRKRMVIEEVESDEETPPTKGKESKGKKNRESTPVKSKIEEIKSTKVKTESKPVNAERKSAKMPPKKTSIKETSSGLPRVSKTFSKLEKVTPYEFMSAWNSLKKSETYEPYYDLLKQVKPTELKTVISNKLDGHMLGTIVKCILEHFLRDGQTDASYQLMQNLSTVPRFGTVSMFMSSEDKADVIQVMEKLESDRSSSYSSEDIKKLRKAYGV